MQCEGGAYACGENDLGVPTACPADYPYCIKEVSGKTLSGFNGPSHEIVKGYLKLVNFGRTLPLFTVRTRLFRLISKQNGALRPPPPRPSKLRRFSLYDIKKKPAKKPF